ncbi:MAG: hypothetical protein A2275_15135 [Bacteroidetes bacterium RIFOXYA12_FULL_35_11]|nr:MAG: hypothetical protein A2X01_18040 [Bacteroidetes bacterium GWF2_35_48]OFY80199.1 MAG: hypothetical protein A2275_15135 [Bacteroidetes bacterium RIFOXYA12_FULL_35_11]OFY93004.1 MAG: hypothetical protein A2309_14745 [Bacteroidetes bacterium RIFOXYB2_FULL_35_7]OFY95002.1 MAG: hypothetical protein A2491_16830 [Bacteroidetes bacterium RIFOXYC12_FULL_35_7]HBX51720.1 hypothetical protein [Bacteroidales bacterium]
MRVIWKNKKRVRIQRKRKIQVGTSRVKPIELVPKRILGPVTREELIRMTEALNQWLYEGKKIIMIPELLCPEK